MRRMLHLNGVWTGQLVRFNVTTEELTEAVTIAR
jgi:hypothetical protein